MKKLLFVLLILSSSCINENNRNKVNKQNKHVGDIILTNIKENCGNFINQDTFKSGTLFYSVAMTGDRWLANEKKLIGNIDKTIGAIPVQTKENQTGVGKGYLYNSYKWNTPSISLKVQSDFYTDKDSVYVRLWMDKK